MSPDLLVVTALVGIIAGLAWEWQQKRALVNELRGRLRGLEDELERREELHERTLEGERQVFHRESERAFAFWNEHVNDRRAWAQERTELLELHAGTVQRLVYELTKPEPQPDRPPARVARDESIEERAVKVQRNRAIELLEQEIAVSAPKGTPKEAIHAEAVRLYNEGMGSTLNPGASV